MRQSGSASKERWGDAQEAEDLLLQSGELGLEDLRDAPPGLQSRCLANGALRSRSRSVLGDLHLRCSGCSDRLSIPARASWFRCGFRLTSDSIAGMVAVIQEAGGGRHVPLQPSAGT